MRHVTLCWKMAFSRFIWRRDGWPVFYQFALDPVLEEHPEYIEKLNAGEMTYADIPEFTSMCEWFQKAAEKGYFGKNFASDTWDYTSEVLGIGKLQ